MLENTPDTLTKSIADLGKQSWEIDGTGTVTEQYHALHIKRSVEKFGCGEPFFFRFCSI
jgi:hypothetical protein